MGADDFASACWKAWSANDLSLCKPFGWDASTWFAGLTALAGLLVFLSRLATRWRRNPPEVSNHIPGSLGRSRFRNLCRAIKPIMDENYRIFSRFGPNSGRGDGLPKNVRFQLEIWNKLRVQIVENNAQLKAMITNNLSEIPQEHIPIFEQWLDHIDAFHAHTLDPAADYREHQFPRDVSAIVDRNA
jgi:hypothetical protein